MAYEASNHFPLCVMIVHLACVGCQQQACFKNCSPLWLNVSFCYEGCPNSSVDEHASGEVNRKVSLGGHHLLLLSFL